MEESDKSAEAAEAGRGDSSPSSLPTHVGKYRIDGLIGRGAMGIVYKGFDEQIQRPLAIKTIRVEMISDVDSKVMLDRFGREARAAGRCLHPNIVTVFDYVEQDDAPYIVMEYLEAGTLDAVVRSKTLVPLRQVGEIVTQLLLALAHAHEKGVIHRDIKPANILCPSAASIKVTDFGVARLDMLGATTTIANGYGAIGTPNYMSPEQFLGRPTDGRSDLFSTGVILYQLLTGARPFPAANIMELKEKLLHERPKPVTAFRPEFPAALDALVERALARNPDDRFQKCEAFIDALGEAIDAAPSDEAPPLDLTKIAPAGPPDPVGSSMANSMAETLDQDTLRSLESALVESLGPIARIVLKKACSEANDPVNLLDNLSSKIPSEAEASRFRQRAERSLRGDSGLASVQLENAVPDSEVQRAAELLTRYVGPVARVIAKKGAKHAMGVDDFLDRISRSIPNETDQQRFLKEARKG